MVDGISSSSSIANVSFPRQQYEKINTVDIKEPLHSFDLEDKAIISAQAKMLNELEKYNSGAGNDVELAVTTVTSKLQVEAAARVIDTKKHMMDTILNIGRT